MALVFDQIQDQPQLHAFIIGIGKYRHVSDGEDPKMHTVMNIGDLRQLTSPPRSALAIRDLLLQTQAQWQVPLGSIELLLSPAPDDSQPDGPNQNFEAATMANIKRAFADWVGRCDSHEDNIALFYFCGHGVEKGDQFLLAEDFGAGLNPWDESFAFDATRLAFHRIKAETQIFLVDACRKVTSRMLQTIPAANPLMVPDHVTAECLFNLTIKAAARNEEAMGPKKLPSYFTQSLLKIFQRGALAERLNNQAWGIRTGRIAADVSKVLKRIKDTEDFRQRCKAEITESALVFRMNTTPIVEVSIAVDEQARAFFKKLPDGAKQHRQDAVNPWKFNTEAGFYHIGFELDNQPLLQPELIVLEPPSTEVILPTEQATE